MLCSKLKTFWVLETCTYFSFFVKKDFSLNFCTIILILFLSLSYVYSYNFSSTTKQSCCKLQIKITSLCSGQWLREIRTATWKLCKYTGSTQSMRVRLKRCAMVSSICTESRRTRCRTFWREATRRALRIWWNSANAAPDTATATCLPAWTSNSRKEPATASPTDKSERCRSCSLRAKEKALKLLPTQTLEGAVSKIGKY